MTTILVVEDILDNAELAGRVLAAQGYEVLKAADAETGLQLAVERRPDLILVDMGLPDVDGQTLVSWMRRMPEFASTPILAWTAWPEETAVKMVKAYGCNGYIRKPLTSIPQFAAQIASYLR